MKPLFGPEVVPARRSPPQGRKSGARSALAVVLLRALEELASSCAPSVVTHGMPTTGIFGPSFGGSSASAALQSSLGNRLRVTMGRRGSLEFAVRWRLSDMLLGAPICALRASARRTSGRGCSGWQTPKASDTFAPRDQAKRMKKDRKRDPKYSGNYKLDLADQVGLAGWGTPTSRDAKDGACDQANVPIKGLLSRQAVRLPAHGLTTKSYPVGTESRGVLNPEFSRWLMGFPVVWGSCGGTAMRSARKQQRRLSKRIKKR